MNLTITADEEVIERARERARAQGTNLQALLRSYLESLAGEASPEALADELIALMKEHGGSSGAPFRREDVYEEQG